MNSNGNYPPGAARDPEAPWNREPAPLAEVLVVETLTRKADIQLPRSVHPCDADKDDARQAYLDQHPTLEQTLARCQCVLRTLIRNRANFVGDIHLPRLLMECEGWATEDTEVDWF